MTTTTNEVDALVARGATYQPLYLPPPPILRVIGGVRWLTKPRRLRWYEPFPQDQHHVHEAQYTRLARESTRSGIEIWKGREMVGRIRPIAESELDRGAAMRAWSEWREELARYGNQEQFERFLADAI